MSTIKVVEIEAGRSEMVRANFNLLGLEDKVMKGQYVITKGYGGEVVKTVVVEPAPLSSLCNHKRHHNLEKGLMAGFVIVVSDETGEVGYIDSDRCYHGGSSLRMALGYAVSTDLGMEVLLSTYDLDAEVVRLINAIKKLEPCIKTLDYNKWSEVWMRALKKAMEYEYGSRFGDGYCNFANELWGIGVREVLGVEHKGFVFLH